MYNCFQCLPGIKVAVPLHIGIYDHRYRMGSDHGSCIVGCQSPHGQNSAFIIFPQEGPDQLLVVIRPQYGEQGMQGTVGVP